LRGHALINEAVDLSGKAAEIENFEAYRATVHLTAKHIRDARVRTVSTPAAVTFENKWSSFEQAPRCPLPYDHGNADNALEE